MEEAKQQIDELKNLLWAADPILYFKKFPDETRVINKVLNQDCLGQILKILPRTDLLNARLVSKEWNTSVRALTIWRDLIHLEFEESFATTDHNFFQYYLNKSMHKILI